jgi:hypothetical protein
MVVLENESVYVVQSGGSEFMKLFTLGLNQ